MIVNFLKGHIEPLSLFYFAACLSIIYGFFYYKYKVDKLVFFRRDGHLSKFEQDFLEEFPKYFLWAAAQQSIVIVPLILLDAPPVAQVAIAIIFFSAIHLPNIMLFRLTLALACLIYPVCFLYKNLFIYFVALHALGGTLGKLAKWEMRVLWNYPGRER